MAQVKKPGSKKIGRDAATGKFVPATGSKTVCEKRKAKIKETETTQSTGPRKTK